jgi:hypothetical protein
LHAKANLNFYTLTRQPTAKSLSLTSLNTIAQEKTRTMPKNYTYTDAGVNRKQRAESKKALQALQETYKYSRFGPVMHLPYGNIFPLSKDTYLDLTIEGVGTKVLLAQLAEKYDSIGVDAVAMAVNDVIRSGAIFTRKPANPNS